MSVKPVFSRAVVGGRAGSESRSTSAGTHSNSPGDPAASYGLPDFEYPAPFNLAKLPDTTYPSPFVIKNTFIDAKAQPSFDSLADFLEDRKTRSCPVSRILSGAVDEYDGGWLISRAATTDCEALVAAAAEALIQSADDVEADARYSESHDIFDTASTFGVCEPPVHWDRPECTSDESVGNDALFDTASTFEALDVGERSCGAVPSIGSFQEHDFVYDAALSSESVWPCHAEFALSEEALELQAHHAFEQADSHRVVWGTVNEAAFNHKDATNGVYSMRGNLRPDDSQRSMFESCLDLDCREGEGEAEAYIRTVLGLATQPSHVMQSFDDAALMSRIENVPTQMPPPPPFQAPVLDASQRPLPAPPPPPDGPPPSSAPVLLLSAALPPSESRIEGLPSFGSQCHTLGTCQPCAFFHTQGCQNGLSCEFCHLCGPGEKKKRLREKRAARREAKLSGFLLAAGAV